MKRQGYLINGFGALFRILEQHLPYQVNIFFPKPSRFDIITNFRDFFFHSIAGKFKKYDIIHINNWENFLNFWNRKGKIIIGESHGFHFGLNFSDTLKHFHGIKKGVAGIVDFLLKKLIHYRIKKFDLYYVSTPNMLEHAKKIRSDAKWLPNAVDFNIFKTPGEKADMKGDPIVFYPTRIHSFKNPKFGIDLFHKIKKKYPQAVLHLIHYPNGGDAHYTKYRKELINENDYVWHNFKTKQELAAMFRTSDIVLGHFHQDLGMMSLVELQASACGAAVISYDKYEINTHLNDLEDIAFKILANKSVKQEFISKNREIVIKNHSPENIVKSLQKDISRSKKGIHIKRVTKKLIKKHMDDILKIEDQCLSEVGTWELHNFSTEYYNKFDCSYLLFKGSRVIGYIIGYTTNQYGYVNRLAVSQDESGQGLGNYLMTCFHDNLKYNLSIDKVELVTHDSLSVDFFYHKQGYHIYEDTESIKDFLIRRGKRTSQKDYIGAKKYMKVFYKNL